VVKNKYKEAQAKSIAIATEKFNETLGQLNKKIQIIAANVEQVRDSKTSILRQSSEPVANPTKGGSSKKYRKHKRVNKKTNKRMDKRTNKKRRRSNKRK